MPAPNPDKLKLVKDFSRPAIVFAVARVPETARLFFGCSDAKVSDADLAQGKREPKELIGHTSYVTGLALAGKTVVSGGYDGRLIWWKLSQPRQIRAVAAHQKWIRAVVATDD